MLIARLSNNVYIIHTFLYFIPSDYNYTEEDTFATLNHAALHAFTIYKQKLQLMGLYPLVFEYDGELFHIYYKSVDYDFDDLLDDFEPFYYYEYDEYEQPMVLLEKLEKTKQNSVKINSKKPTRGKKLKFATDKRKSKTLESNTKAATRAKATDKVKTKTRVPVSQNKKFPKKINPLIKSSITQESSFKTSPAASSNNFISSSEKTISPPSNKKLINPKVASSASTEKIVYFKHKTNTPIIDDDVALFINKLQTTTMSSQTSTRIGITTMSNEIKTTVADLFHIKQNLLATDTEIDMEYSTTKSTTSNHMNTSWSSTESEQNDQLEVPDKNELRMLFGDDDGNIDGINDDNITGVHLDTSQTLNKTISGLNEPVTEAISMRIDAVNSNRNYSNGILNSPVASTLTNFNKETNFASTDVDVSTNFPGSTENPAMNITSTVMLTDLTQVEGSEDTTTTNVPLKYYFNEYTMLETSTTSDKNDRSVGEKDTTDKVAKVALSAASDSSKSQNSIQTQTTYPPKITSDYRRSDILINEDEDGADVESYDENVFAKIFGNPPFLHDVNEIITKEPKGDQTTITAHEFADGTKSSITQTLLNSQSLFPTSSFPLIASTTPTAFDTSTLPYKGIEQTERSKAGRSMSYNKNKTPFEFNIAQWIPILIQQIKLGRITNEEQMALKTLFPLQWKEIQRKIRANDIIEDDDIDPMLQKILERNQRHIVRI